MAYLVPASYGEAEFVEKRSRFIGQVWPIESGEQAKELIAGVKAKYYDARHNCWCYILHGGEPGGTEAVRYTDDGEPQGTAGQPMLEVSRRAGVENILCVVTRYFGGILLGAGGLARAYAHTAKLALDAAGVAEMRLWTCLEIVCPYGLLERVKKEIKVFGGRIESTDYGAGVALGALFPEENLPPFETRLADLTSGAVTGVVTGTKYAPIPVER